MMMWIRDPQDQTLRVNGIPVTQRTSEFVAHGMVMVAKERAPSIGVSIVLHDEDEPEPPVVGLLFVSRDPLTDAQAELVARAWVIKEKEDSLRNLKVFGLDHITVAMEKLDLMAAGGIPA